MPSRTSVGRSNKTTISVKPLALQTNNAFLHHADTARQNGNTQRARGTTPLSFHCLLIDVQDNSDRAARALLRELTIEQVISPRIKAHLYVAGESEAHRLAWLLRA